MHKDESPRKRSLSDAVVEPKKNPLEEQKMLEHKWNNMSEDSAISESSKELSGQSDQS